MGSNENPTNPTVNPLLNADRKCKKLKSLLERQPASRAERLPFISPHLHSRTPSLKSLPPELTASASASATVPAPPASSQPTLYGRLAVEVELAVHIDLLRSPSHNGRQQDCNCVFRHPSASIRCYLAQTGYYFCV